MRVAVLDTCVDRTHLALAGRPAAGYDFVDMDADPHEERVPGAAAAYGHRTHVARLIAAVDPEATIIPLRVLDPDGVGNVRVVAEALRYAINPGGNFPAADGAHVISLSIGTQRQTRLLREIVDDVRGGGESPAWGVGAWLSSLPQTSLVPQTPDCPAAEDVHGLLAMVATTACDTLLRFSNRGSWVHVAAPGVGILGVCRVGATPPGAERPWRQPGGGTSGPRSRSPSSAGRAAGGVMRSGYGRVPGRRPAWAHPHGHRAERPIRRLAA